MTQIMKFRHKTLNIEMAFLVKVCYSNNAEVNTKLSKVFQKLQSLLVIIPAGFCYFKKGDEVKINNSRTGPVNPSTKNRIIQVRVNEAEYAQVVEAMHQNGSHSVSAYIRLCILNPLHNQNDFYRQELHRIAFRIGKVSGILDQINRNIEMGMFSSDELLKEDPFTELNEVLSQTKDLLTHISHEGKEFDGNGNH